MRIQSHPPLNALLKFAENSYHLLMNVQSHGGPMGNAKTKRPVRPCPAGKLHLTLIEESK